MRDARLLGECRQMITSGPSSATLELTMHRKLIRLSFATIAAVVCLCCSIVRAGETAPPDKNLRVYHIGNSLTRNVPLERLQRMFASAGGEYAYGIQQQVVWDTVAGHPHSGVKER